MLPRSNIKVNLSLEGETIETKVERVTTLKEPITDSAEIIYTDRKDGVIPDYDIRSDRFEFAIDGMDKVAKAQLAKRDDYLNKRDLNPTPDDKVVPKPTSVDKVDSIPAT